jgi:hypothetical protein
VTDVEPQLDSGQPGPAPLEPIDLLLGEGDAEGRERLRAAIVADPVATFAMAETVALLERCRELRVEPGATFAAKLADVVARAERRLLPPPSPWVGPLWGLAAAAIVFALLRLWDPLRGPTADAAPAAVAVPVEPAPAADGAVDEPAPVRVLDVRAVAWQEELDTMRRRLEQEPMPQLREALEAGVGAHDDALGGWLDPRNTLMLMRLDHELRANAATRREALRRQGGLAAADERVQELADSIGRQLLDAIPAADADAADAGAVALGVRALIAAGPGGAERARALAAGSDWLARRVVVAIDAELVACLAALVEVAAVTGAHRELAASQGERLVRLVLHVDAENWSRRLPDLLGARMAPGVLAEASRVLGRLPGLGVDGARCALVRRLLLGPLRERRARGEDSPQLVAAMLYGSADLLPEPERDALELQLRRWKPVRLVPDFATAQQHAWALAPGRYGHTRHQAELRQLAVCADPRDLGPRAAFCLCLATGYAGSVGALARFATGS